MSSTLERRCGACQLCCTLLSVATIQKPMNTPCAHAVGGRCAIYATRPYACRHFDCLWLQGVGSDAQQPHRIHAVWSVIGEGDLVVHEDPAYEGVGRAASREVMARAWRAGKRVLLCVGDGRYQVIPPD